MRIEVVLSIVRSCIHRKRGQVLGIRQDLPQQDFDQPLNSLLANLLLGAKLSPLVGTVVVVIPFSHLARAVHPLHPRAALTAVQLPREPVTRGAVLPLATSTLRSMAFVQGHAGLNPLERLFVDKGRHPAFNDNAAMVVLTDVRAVLEHLVQGLHGEFAPANRAHAASVELFRYVLHGHAFCVLGEHALDERRGRFVHNIFLGCLVNVIPEQLVAVVEGVLGVVHHAAPHVHRELEAVVLREGLHHSLHEHALRGLGGNRLGEEVDAAARLADGVLCHGQHVTVAPEPVGLPQHEGVGLDLAHLRKHLLKARALLERSRDCSVFVLPHNLEAVRLRPCMGKLALLVDARLVLGMG